MKKALVCFLLIAASALGTLCLSGCKKCAQSDKAGLPTGKPDLIFLQAKGRIVASNEGVLALAITDSGNYFILDGPLSGELAKFKNKEVEVVGNVIPVNPVKFKNKTVNVRLEVVAFGDSLFVEDGVPAIRAPLLALFQEKIDAKRQLRQQVIKKYKKTNVFDLAKGRLSKENREVAGKGSVEHVTLRTEDGDTFLVTGPALEVLIKNFSIVSKAPVVLLGSEALPNKEFILKTGEITFVAEEAFNSSLDQIK